MALTGNRSTLPQVGDRLGTASSGSARTSVFSIPNSSKQDQYLTSFVSWAHGDSKHSGNKPDMTEQEREIDLQSLVSDIVHEADSSESCLDEDLLPMWNSIWSPKKAEELLHFQLDARTQQNHSNPPSYTSHNGFIPAQQQLADKDSEGLHKQLNSSTQKWFLNGSYGDIHLSSVQMLPQILPISNQENMFWLQHAAYDNDQPMNNIPDTRDVYVPSDEINRSSYVLFPEEHYAPSSINPISYEPYTSEDVKQLMCHYESVLHLEPGTVCLGSVSDSHKLLAGLNYDNNVAEHWKINNSAEHIPKQSNGEMKPFIMECNEDKKKPMLKREDFLRVPDFSTQSGGFYQQPKPSLSHVNFMNQIWKQVPIYSENVHVNGYFKQHNQLKQMHSNIKPQTQKEKWRMLVPGVREGGSPMGAQTDTPMSADVNQTLSQIPYLDYQGNVKPQKCVGDNGTYPVKHQTRALGMANNMLMNQGRLFQFYVHLDECYEQWRCLEKERMMAEDFSMTSVMVKRSTTESNSTLPKLSPNPAIINQLVNNLMRELSKVENLLYKMECVHKLSLTVNIHAAVSRQHTAICVLLERLKEVDQHKQPQSHCFAKSKDVMLTDVALKDLAAATRQLRTALWCSVQMIIPFPDKKDTYDSRESDASPCQRYSFNR